jgi:hypothetical protein
MNDTMNDVEYLRTISPEELALLGNDEIVYLKTVIVDSKTACAINRANGQQVAIMKDFDTAIAVAIDNEFLPFSVH